jgi:hypothetical protein
MKSMVRYVFVVVCIVGLLSSFATAQDLQEQLSKLGHDAAVSYITPILAGWGADLNSGFYYSADLHDVLGFDVGLKLAMTRITDDDKTYTLDLPPTIIYQGVTFTRGTHYPAQIKAATAVGEEKETEVKSLAAAGPGGIVPAGTTIFALPGGFNLPSVPLIMPQLAIGLPFGLEVIGRFIPTVSAGDAGKFNYIGFGLRYDIDQWLPAFPVDIAVHFATQKLSFKSKDDKDIFTGKATAFGFEASKRFFILTLYGGFQLESASLSLNDFTGYDPQTGLAVPISGFEVKEKNKSRFTLGVRVLLLFINVHADYSFAKTPVATLGAGISIR